MKKNASFYSSLVWMIVLNVVIKPAWVFGIDRQVQNQVGVEQYGTYFSLFNLSVVCSFLLDWGVTTYFNRHLAIHSGRTQPVAKSLLQLKLLFIGAYSIIVLLAAWMTNVQHWDIVIYVILIQALYSLLLFLRAVITARQFFNIDAWVSVIDKSLMILIAGFILYYPPLSGSITVEVFAALQAACLAVAVLVALLCLWKKDLLHYLRFNGFPGKFLLRQAFPFALVVLLMSLHARFDAFMLDRLNKNGAYETGVYAGAYRLLDAANMVGVLSSSFLLPYIAKRWSNKEEINEVVLTGRHFLMMFSVGLAAVAFFIPEWIQQLLYHHNDDRAVQVLKWCIPSLIAYSVTHLYGTVLTATGHIRAFCLIISFAVCINLILNLSLIPRYGATGCCIAALASQTAGCIGVAVYASKKMRLAADFRSVLVYIFTAIASGLIFTVGTTWRINEFILIAIAGSLSLLVMSFTGMIRIKKWVSPELKH